MTVLERPYALTAPLSVAPEVDTAEAALVTAAACAEWDAIDWEADRLAYRRARREDEDTQFQMGWDAYGQE